MHPILDSLDRTDHEWIKKLLFTFNEGSIGKFEALAPVFMHEVRLTTLRSIDFQPKVFFADTTTRKLPFPPPKNLFDGAHRVRIQAECQRPNDVFPNHRGGDEVANRRSGAFGHEGIEVRFFSSSLCSSFPVLFYYLTHSLVEQPQAHPWNP